MYFFLFVFILLLKSIFWTDVTRLAGINTAEFRGHFAEFLINKKHVIFKTQVDKSYSGNYGSGHK